MNMLAKNCAATIIKFTFLWFSRCGHWQSVMNWYLQTVKEKGAFA